MTSCYPMEGMRDTDYMENASRTNIILPMMLSRYGSCAENWVMGSG